MGSSIWMRCMVKMRHEGRVENRAVYVAIGSRSGRQEGRAGAVDERNGRSEVLAAACLTELRNRGVKDILIACVDGLKGFPQAIETRIPEGAGAVVHRAHGAERA